MLTYNGTPKHVNHHYRERFHVDALTAARDLQELGINYTQEQLDQIKHSEEHRLRQKRMEKEAKAQYEAEELYRDCDGRFAFIAGYTSGGAPYGVQWEEVGIDPELPFEEKVRLYRSGEYAMPDMNEFDDYEGDVLIIEVLPHMFSICKVEDYSAVNLEEEFCFTGKTDGEKSLVCLTNKVPPNTTERADGWRAFRIAGSLDFSLIGILAKISGALAECNISIFAFSTFDTDYILVKKQDLNRAVNALSREGYQMVEA